MEKPNSIATRRVAVQYVIGAVDGPDADDEPDFIPARGVVEFTASVLYTPYPVVSGPNPMTVLNAKITGVLDSEGYLCTPDPANPTLPGKRGVRLLCTDNVDGSVANWTWTAAPKFVDANGTRIPDVIPPFSFYLPADPDPNAPDLDLTTVVKVPASQGVGNAQAEALAALASAAAASSASSAEVAVAAALDVKRRADAGEFKGEPGPEGPNTVPTQEAVAGYVATAGNPVNAAVSATVATQAAQQVPTLVAKAIAADGTIAVAAEGAVASAITGLDLLRASDPRVPRAGDGDSFQVVNTDGGVPFQVARDSTFVGNTEIAPSDDRFTIESSNGRLLFDIDPVSGQVYAPSLKTDSLIGGQQSGSATRVVLNVGAGQSNMRGKAWPFGNGLDIPDPRVQMWDWTAQRLATATVPLSGPTTNATDGYSLLNEISKQTALEEPSGTIVVNFLAAVGNTTLVGEAAAGTWGHDYTGPVPHLYNQMVTELPKVISAIQSTYKTAPEIRLYWHQGEADAGVTATYSTKFDALVADFRTRFGASTSVVLGGMVPEYIATASGRDAIRAAHIQTPFRLLTSAYVDGIPNGGGSSQVTDIVHYHREGAEKMGRAMYAARRRALANRANSIPYPPLSVSATLIGGVLTASWDAPLCRVTDYTAEYSVDGSTWLPMAKALPLSTTANASEVTGTPKVRVSTTNTVGTSAPSTPITALGV